MEFLASACQQLMRDILWPECRVTTATIPNLQKYQLPEIIDVIAVYLQGRLCIPTTKSIMEGNAIGKWDDGSIYQYGGPQYPPVPGNDGPQGNTGYYAPQWTVQTPAQYPQANTYGGGYGSWPVPTGAPWNCGSRPSFYLEGGFIGFVPTPNAGPVIINGEVQNNIDIRCILPHPDVVDEEMNLWFPESCLSPLAWNMNEQMGYSDNSQTSMGRAQYAATKYEREKNQRRTDIKVYTNARNQDNPKMITGRQYWNGQIIRQGPF